MKATNAQIAALCGRKYSETGTPVLVVRFSRCQVKDQPLGHFRARVAERVPHVVREDVSEPFWCELGQRVGMPFNELVRRGVADLGQISEKVTSFP